MALEVEIFMCFLYQKHKISVMLFLVIQSIQLGHQIKIVILVRTQQLSIIVQSNIIKHHQNIIKTSSKHKNNFFKIYYSYLIYQLLFESTIKEKTIEIILTDIYRSFFQYIIRQEINNIYQLLKYIIITMKNSTSKNQKQCNQVIAQRQFHQQKWLGIKLLDYRINGQIVKDYQTIYRTTTKKSGIAGVNILPIIKYKQKESEIVFIANFRPAVGKFVMEFPAGLVDNEDLKKNAIRQLKQEAGMTAYKFVQIPLPRNYCDPWKSDECGIFYIGLIDGDDPNAITEQQLEEQENIRVHRLPLNQKLAQNLCKVAEQKQYVFEGKVWCIALGFVASLSNII